MRIPESGEPGREGVPNPRETPWWAPGHDVVAGVGPVHRPPVRCSYVEYLRLVLVAVNSMAFLTLMVMSIRLRRREKYVWVQRLWTIIAIACGALVLGSVQRLALQSVAVGWTTESVAETFTGDLQLVQSLAVLVLVLAAFLTLRKLAASMDASERLSFSLLDRVRHVDPKSLRLTNREAEVLALIGEGVTTDAGLAAELHISASTVQSHVKSLFRKTGLNSRMDLIALAMLVGSAGSGG